MQECRAESLKSQLKEIAETLQDIADKDPSSGAQADGLLKAISNFDFVFNLYVMEAVFGTTNILSKYLQSVSISLSLALEKVKAVLLSLKDTAALDTCTKLGFDDHCMPRQRKVLTRVGGGDASPSYRNARHYYQISYFYSLLDVLHQQIAFRKMICKS